MAVIPRQPSNYPYYSEYPQYPDRRRISYDSYESIRRSQSENVARYNVQNVQLPTKPRFHYNTNGKRPSLNKDVSSNLPSNKIQDAKMSIPANLELSVKRQRLSTPEEGEVVVESSLSLLESHMLLMIHLHLKPAKQSTQIRFFTVNDSIYGCIIEFQTEPQFVFTTEHVYETKEIARLYAIRAVYIRLNLQQKETNLLKHYEDNVFQGFKIPRYIEKHLQDFKTRGADVVVQEKKWPWISMLQHTTMGT